MRLLLRSPFLDLRDKSGKTVPGAVGKSEEEKADLRSEIAKTIAEAIRGALSLLGCADPSLQIVISHGLYVTVDDEGGHDVRELLPPADRVAEHDMTGRMACHLCRSAATGWQLKGTCFDCARKSAGRAPPPPAIVPSSEPV